MKAAHIFRQNLRRARLFSGLTQEGLAEMAGLAIDHYQDIERGKRPDLMLSTIERLAHALGVDVWMLLQKDQFPDAPRKRGRSSYRIVR